MFSRAAKQPDREGSTIAVDAILTGDIVSTGSLHIDGTINGDVRCARLSQGPSGAVHGNIVAEEARLAGLVDGAVEAGALVLEASARVTGDILYQSVGVAPGAQVDGRLRRSKGPADHGAVAARAQAAATVANAAAIVSAPPLDPAATVPPTAPAATSTPGEAIAPTAPARAAKRGARSPVKGLELFAPSVEAAE